MQQYDWLLAKLDAFIRKYYINQLIRGGLILLICLVFYVLAVSVSEYYLYLPVWLKVSLAGIFVVLGAGALIFWIILPLAKMARLGKTLSHEEAAGIIGTHFPEISDKLLNILQLKKQSDGQSSRELIEASINQKAGQISVVPISGAVDLSKNRKFLPYLLPLLLVGVFILVAAPNVFKDASERLLQPTREFSKPAPFTFTVLTTPIMAVRNGDYVLKAVVKGSALPAELSLVLNEERIPMTALDNHIFQYTIKNITEPITFRLYGAGFYSQPYTISLVQKPVLKALKVNIDYPDYTGRKDELRNSLGDLVLPVGTKVGWGVYTQFTDEAHLRWESGASVNLPKHSDFFGYQHQFMSDSAYTISLHNKQSPIVDSFHYRVQVIQDQHPMVELRQFRDSVAGKQVLITGTAGDDYAISKVLFHYRIATDKGQTVASKSWVLKTGGGALVPFEQYFDIQTLNLQQGQKVEYFIEAWDNDGVHGPKASRSEMMSYHMYTPNQLDSAMDENARQISSGLSNSAQQTKQLQKELKDVQNQMLQGGEMSFEQQQNLQELSEKQEQLQKQIENTKKRFEEQVQQSQQKEYSEDVREKQEEVKKQLDNLLNNELKEQMKKLEELMKRLNKDNAFQTAQQLEQENKLFNMDLQRMQELMKQLEMQMRMEDLANKLDKLATQQGDLKKATDNKRKESQALSKEQKDLKKELDKTMNEDMKELKDLNDKSQKKQDLDDSKEAGQKAQQEMQKSGEELDQNQNSKSSQSQKQAQENLQKMADDLRKQSGGMDQKQIEIDIKATRQLLTNLIRLSFDQEKLMDNVKHTATSSKEYLVNQSEQSRLHGNSQMIRDSLFSLSKRVFKLAPTINKETTDLERQMKAATSSLESRMNMDALVKQQYVMTHTNNLALMLNELLSNLMQMQNQAKQPGSGSCSKPGGMNPKPGAGAGKQLSDIITQQQQLSDKAAKQAGKDGKDGQEKGGKEGEGDKPGDKDGGKQAGGKQPGGKDGKGGKEGQNGTGNGGGEGNNEGEGEYGDAEQLARMANQQATIRRQLQELQNKLNGTGMGNSKELREIQQQMDRNENDLVNRRLSSEFLKRQKEILSRLLEAEKSIREQEQDNKRSSNTAKEVARPVPAELQQYLKDRQQMLELYRTVPPQLKPYYRSMVEQYFKTIGAR
jgi:hypothetical protein